MSAKRRHAILVLLLLVVFTFIFSHCHGSRNSNVFNWKPNHQHQTGQYMSYMPKRVIPVSGPSRKHNSIGLQSWRSP
ncbi:hypothetical protein Leryth_006499 [Lithospermum erythrorhizon]|nr:hypothetical protein Leryth_006499 [Lithospermum erythrorhizon]